MITFFLTFFCSLLLTLVLTPIIKYLAIRQGMVDKPSKRKLHKSPIPHMGGVGIFLSFLVTILIFSDKSKTTYTIITCGSLIVLIGLLDDILHLNAWQKLIGQIGVAILTVYFGVTISFVTNPFGGVISLDWLAVPLTILWIVGIMNTINLIDGMDGLAAGIASISAIILSFVALHTGQFASAILTIALFGACLGFLRYNFSPAQIFMGDAGSMFIGYILAIASIVGVLKSTITLSLIIPVIVLGFPISDMLYAIFRRLKNGQAIFKPDNGHFHHRLLNKGFSHKQVVLLIYGLTIGLGILAMLMSLKQ